MRVACVRMGGLASSFPHDEAITAGGYHTRVLTLAQGAHSQGPSPMEDFPPSRVSLPHMAAPVAIGAEVYCLDSNESVQLGDGTEINRNTPVAVNGLPRFMGQERDGITQHRC